MNLKADYVEKSLWEQVLTQSHRNLFDEKYLEDAKDFNYAVCVTDEHGQRVAFATIKEMDSETANMCFGGMISDFREKDFGYECMKLIVSKLLPKYLRVGFQCRANNGPMIKLGLNEGFEIIGMRMIYGSPHLELLLEGGN